MSTVERQTTRANQPTADRIHTQYDIADGLAVMPYCYSCKPPRKLRAGRQRWWRPNHPNDIHPERR